MSVGLFILGFIFLMIVIFTIGAYLMGLLVNHIFKFTIYDDPIDYWGMGAISNAIIIFILLCIVLVIKYWDIPIKF